jgi:quercetin dioxygenase-like cupin family protein
VVIKGSEAKGAVREGVRRISSARGQWQDMPVPGVKMIPLRGDMERGAHASFIRFPAGADHGWHTHTHDVSMVVLEGAYLYRDEQGETRVGAGDYFFIPGGTKHWSGSGPNEGCIFYQESPDSFDLNPVEE